MTESLKHEYNKKINDLKNQIDILNKKNSELELKNNKLILNNIRVNSKIDNIKNLLDDLKVTINNTSDDVKELNIILDNALNNTLNNLDKKIDVSIKELFLSKLNSDSDKIDKNKNFISKFINCKTIINLTILGFIIISNLKKK